MHTSVSSPAGRLALVIEPLVRALRASSDGTAISSSAASTLGRLEREGPKRITELAHAEQASQPGMTQLIARMEGEGLVSRAASETDRRSVVVSLTDAGRAALAQRRARRISRLEGMLAELDPGDRDAIAAALPALERLVEAADAGGRAAG